LVEIDAGDHPIDLPHDAAAVAPGQGAAADRLFALLPDDQGPALRAIWEEFEGMQGEAAQLAKTVDYAIPVLQVWAADPRRADHEAIARDNTASGRARLIARTRPALFDHLHSEMSSGTPEIAARSAFLAEADRLKGVSRATTLCDASRHENSAEHSWHLALFALVLGEHAPEGVSLGRVLRMLLLHDLVEIDAGDVPIYAQTAENQAATEAAELAAAERLFGLLPAAEGAPLLALWQEFEAAESPDAQFAKALDRFQPPLQNLASGGVSWKAHNATFEMVEARVGAPIARSMPAFWEHIAPQIRAFLA
ncbi:HD domain-containing protein, partial [Oceanicola sp. S124]|uniref:HD domain-containing protein n=1 Tax=Oceanicola sp. S124 TaxID=1042378 RepID=UPI0004942E41